jgi:opacity protein-like surface antigen
MNKNIRLAGLVILLACGLCNFAQADETPQPPIRLDGLYTYLGVQAGINFASLSGDGSAILGSRTGFQAGVQMDVPYTPYFSLMPELRYVQRGFSFNSVGNPDSAINYIELPVLAKINLPTGNPLTPFLLFGPNFALKTGTDVTSVHTFDFGLNFGLGAQFQVTQTSRFFLDFEYYLGLTDITSGTDLKNSVPEINVGFSWAL